ncbi:hypothetical protein DFS34DRAFT_578565 [Phlyctochytrium arcticum]|nr:hypothetical protein DFS34DRAFT_578565 [Phlyctochytrium arcticum]
MAAAAATAPVKATYTADEVAQHSTARSLWIVVHDKVYDVSQFMFDHPGGEELLLQYGGQDVTQVMQDELEHLHSESAYDMLDDYYIGDYPKTITSTLGKKEPFIELDKPMLAQVWRKDWSKDFYLTQVHIPRHISSSAPIFGHPALEVFTKTPWYVIPLVWIPMWIGSIYLALNNGPPSQMAVLMASGIMLWSILEYSLHRFLFHIEVVLPDNRVALTAHFLLHGIHHYLPMDKMRLVMPPALSLFLASWIYVAFSSFLPFPVVCGLATGVIPGYVGYDLIHYYLHHGRPFAQHLRDMKTYHLDHHYKDANLGYGITSKLWDRVFGTVLY